MDGVADFLGESAYAALNREQLVPALLATEGSSQPVAVLTRLFLLAEPTAVELLDQALPGIGAEGLAKLGLIELKDGLGHALADLRPYAFQDDQGEVQLQVASDLAAHQRPGVLRRDHVLGIGGASLTLAQATIRNPVEKALDLGTGCGIQTLHLLRHARQVTATDISERALAFTRFNLLLNAELLGLNPQHLEERVQLKQGSLLEPVQGEEFDLVVSNPPFVITPRHRGESAAEQFTYRDAGLPGDQLVSSLLQALPAVLSPGGSAQLLGNWEISAAQPWQQRVEPWVAGITDCWVIQREEISPEQYAETWLQDASQGRDATSYADSYRDYLQDFAARNVQGIGFGMVWLRRGRTEAALSTLHRFEDLSHPLEQPIAPYLAAAVERADWLSTTELATAKLTVAEDVTEERHQRPGAEHPGVILLRQGAGLRRTTLLSTELAGFVSACDGTLSVGQIEAALAALLDRELELFDQVRELVLDGFLLPDEAQDNHANAQAEQQSNAPAEHKSEPRAE